MQANGGGQKSLPDRGDKSRYVRIFLLDFDLTDKTIHGTNETGEARSGRLYQIETTNLI